MTVLTQGIAAAVLEELVSQGVTDFCIAPGGRNAPFVALLKHEPTLRTFYFNDERCAGFFALGRSRQFDRPVAVIVTSGTAVAHLLAPAMEAYYMGIPLVLITADRPRRFRGSNAPQSCEQLGIFGQYATCHDVADGDTVSLDNWDRRRPLHLNVCLEEPKDLAKESQLNLEPFQEKNIPVSFSTKSLEAFLQKSRAPFVTVGTLKREAREAVVQFLVQLGAPVYLEAISGLREEPRLQALALRRVDKMWEHGFDAVLRIGGVPTPRFWRDLEEMEGKIPVFSINEEPFSGLSWGSIEVAPLRQFFESYCPPCRERRIVEKNRETLFAEEPTAEPSLIHALSKLIPEEATLFLGQSLPIRTWDMAACTRKRHSEVFASRGLNGIDGQLSTFFGLCKQGGENWAILGDLTALHDLGGWWVLSQLQTSVKVVIVNNRGGKIFSRMFSDKELQNQHQLNFEPLAKLWGVSYARLERIPEKIEATLIELCPDDEATTRFWKKCQ